MQHFAIDFDICSLEPVGQPAVVAAQSTGTGVDPHDPKPSKLAFAHFAVAIGKPPRALDGHHCRAKQAAATAHEAFRRLHDLVAAAPSLETSFCPGHRISPTASAAYR